jgi:hypothetical protein
VLPSNPAAKLDVEAKDSLCDLCAFLIAHHSQGGLERSFDPFGWRPFSSSICSSLLIAFSLYHSEITPLVKETGSMAKPVTIGTQTFDTKDAAPRFIRKILYRHPLRAPIVGPDHTVLLGLLGKHPSADEKIGFGVKHFTVEKAMGGSQCFYITRVDGSRSGFSFERCLTE